MSNDFCIFILSHKRPDNTKTLDQLNKAGYTGDWYIVVDHKDGLENYYETFGEDSVLYLNKDDALPGLDRGDNFNHRSTPLYTRYQIWDLADDLGYDYFMMMDDDYEGFRWKFDEQFNFHNYIKMKNIESFLKSGIEYLKTTDVDCLAMAQGGDFIGGIKSAIAEDGHPATRRKVMNTFLCKTDSKFDFRGVLNDDVNTYVRAAQYGKIFLTANIAQVDQEETQQFDGGLTELYLDQGTYVKSFYTILYSPSCTKLSKISGSGASRIHHRISWNNAVPKIVPESAKNEAD